jgi:hypothetical protein
MKKGKQAREKGHIGDTRHRRKGKQARDTGNIGHTRPRTKDKQARDTGNLVEQSTPSHLDFHAYIQL